MHSITWFSTLQLEDFSQRFLCGLHLGSCARGRTGPGFSRMWMLAYGEARHLIVIESFPARCFVIMSELISRSIFFFPHILVNLMLKNWLYVRRMNMLARWRMAKLFKISLGSSSTCFRLPHLLFSSFFDFFSVIYMHILFLTCTCLIYMFYIIYLFTLHAWSF